MRVVVDGVGQTFADGRGQSLRALDGVTLAVAAREFVALLGPSGCGKSTLLNLMGGLLTPTEGEVYFEGALSSGCPPTAMVFQEFALFPWRTVQGHDEADGRHRGPLPAGRGVELGPNRREHAALPWRRG